VLIQLKDVESIQFSLSNLRHGSDELGLNFVD
jgi:hypothetical protein